MSYLPDMKPEDPYQSLEYQVFVMEMAKGCNAKDAPCDSCLAGGICDGPDAPDPFENDRAGYWEEDND